MKKIIIIINLVFLLLLTACSNNKEIIKDIIDNEKFEDIIETFDKENKIFINVVNSDEMYVPLEKDNYEIKWEYDKEFLTLTDNKFKVKKDGTTILSATYRGKVHLYSITVKNDNIAKTVQYDLNFYYSFITDNKKIGKKIIPSKIVFHNTANTAPAINEIKWLNSRDNTSTTSFHYAVDDTGVYQAIPTSNASHHAGNYKINNSSIGIEIAKSYSTNEKEKNEGIENATILIALLMNYYNIKIDDVITHYDASQKHCPHDIFDRYGLTTFYEKITELI